MSCTKTEETALVYGPSRLDDTVALTKFIDNIIRCALYCYPKIVNEYDQEIPQSQTADNPVAP